MPRVIVFASLVVVIATASLPARAESNGEPAVTNWDLSVPKLPAYELRTVRQPLTGAARFHAGYAVESLTVHESRFMAPPRFQLNPKQAAVEDAVHIKPDFGPGPELVAPTPSSFRILTQP